jgi:predicted transcriptional regulator
MTDSKIFSPEYSSVQELSDLDIIIRYHFDTPALFDNAESRDRSIAEWRRLAKENPTEVTEMAQRLRQDYIEKLKPEGKQDDMSSEVIQLFDPEPEHTDENRFTITENYVLVHPKLNGRDKMVYVLLDYRAHFPKKTCKASIVWLAEQTGWRRQTISKSLDKLIELKIITRGQHVAGESYTYTLLHRYRPVPKAEKSKRYAKAS